MAEEWIRQDFQRSLDDMTSDRDYWKNLAIKMAQPCTINKDRDCGHCAAKAIVFDYLQSSYKK